MKCSNQVKTVFMIGTRIRELKGRGNKTNLNPDFRDRSNSRRDPNRGVMNNLRHTIRNRLTSDNTNFGRRLRNIKIPGWIKSHTSGFRSRTAGTAVRTGYEFMIMINDSCNVSGGRGHQSWSQNIAGTRRLRRGRTCTGGWRWRTSERTT
jgi:hypothetical protein